MSQIASKKLVLQKETIKNLYAPEMTMINGGIPISKILESAVKLIEATGKAASKVTKETESIKKSLQSVASAISAHSVAESIRQAIPPKGFTGK